MTNATGGLLAVCLNPAWQKAVFFPSLTIGEVNRAERVQESGGGKGINAARAARLLGAPITVAMFAGGETGNRLKRELADNGIADITKTVDAPTRVCTTLVDAAAGTVTEIIEPSGSVSPEDVAALHGALVSAIPSFNGVAICGTSPPGVPETLIAELGTAARKGGATVLLDGVKGVEPLLRAGVDILKVNARELHTLTGEGDLRRAATRCLDPGRIGWIAVTDGPRNAYLFEKTSAVRYVLPRLGSVCSTVGAGDCAAGVLLFLTAGRVLTPALMTEAFAAALAAACASCLSDVPALFEPADARRIQAEIRIENLR